MTPPQTENRDVRKVPKWARHRLEGFLVSEWKGSERLSFSVQESSWSVPGCTLNCEFQTVMRRRAGSLTVQGACV